MTKTNDAATEDTTMSDASLMPHDNSNNSTSTTVEKTSIKIAFKMQKNDSSDVSAKHRDILNALSKCDESLVIFDKDDNHVIISTEYKIDQKFNYEKLPRKHIQLVCVTHAIASKVPISNLKHDISNVLATSRATVTVNTWNTLDVRDVGWLLHMNPRTHNRDNIALRLRQAIQKLTTQSIAKFRLYIKTISDRKPSDKNRLSTQVIAIKCESSSLFTLRDLLHKLYASNNQDLPGKFIPMNFPHVESTNKYTQLIQAQKTYLTIHRNIAVHNVSFDDLNKIIEHNNKTQSILSILEQSKAITWISPDSSSTPSSKINISTTTESYPQTYSLVQNIILPNVTTSHTNVSYKDYNPINSPQIISPTTKTYLSALTAGLPPLPNTSSPLRSHNHSHTISGTNISSITSPTTQHPSTIQLQNIKEHISRSLNIIRQEFTTIQTELRNEIQNLHTQKLAPNQTNPTDLTTNVSNELNTSIESIKQEFESFRTHVQQEMKKQLQTTISIAIATTTENLTKLITTEVDRALRTQLQALSPRNRKPKRSRAPNLDESISQRLFHGRTVDDKDDDDPYELSNSLFEANMLDQPHSPENSDNEEIMQNHP